MTNNAKIEQLPGYRRLIAYLSRIFRRKPLLRPGADWKSEGGVRNLAIGMKRLEDRT